MDAIAFFALHLAGEFEHAGVVDVVGDLAVRDEALRDVDRELALARLEHAALVDM